MGWRRVVPLIAMVACGETGQPPPKPRHASLDEGVVARVGDEPISRVAVQDIVRAQQVSPSAAVELAISDALFARHAQDVLPGALLEAVERGALARAVLEDLQAAARRQGPVTPEERRAVIDRNWYELERPAGARTSHAVVLFKEPKDGARARALAAQIRSATVGISEPAAFEARVKEVETGGLEVKVEHLPAVAADGLLIPDQPPLPGSDAGYLQESFARAAHAIAEVGGQSEITESSYGLHVIVLRERTAEVMLTGPALDARVEAEVIADRARLLEQALFEELGKKTRVRIERDAIDLTSRVAVQP